MIPRGSRVAEQLNSKFINFEGQASIASSVYRDIVKTCAKACATPGENVSEMESFVERQAEYLRTFEM